MLSQPHSTTHFWPCHPLSFVSNFILALPFVCLSACLLACELLGDTEGQWFHQGPTMPVTSYFLPPVILFWLHWDACGILIPRTGIESVHPAV